MTEGFETVQHELDQKRQQIEQELAAVRGREAELEAALERVHEALGALTGHKKKSRNRSRAKKPATTREDLQQHIASVRSQNPFADAGALEKAVRALVQQSGTSLTGFKTLFAEALLTSPGSQVQHSSGSAHGSHHARHSAGHSSGHSSGLAHDEDPFAS
jgi:hypothetical protein